MKSSRSGSQKYYKGKYFLAFYDKNDEFLYSFDNVREILEFMGKDVNRKNVNFVNLQLYRALNKNEEHFNQILGQTTKVYMMDLN